MNIGAFAEKFNKSVKRLSYVGGLLVTLVATCALTGCAMMSVAGAAVSVASTAVSVTANAAAVAADAAIGTAQLAGKVVKKAANAALD